MPRIRSALFFDFDNIFGGLIKLHRRVAYALAEDPRRFLAALTTLGLTNLRRAVLVQRAYMNPAGSIQDAEKGNAQGRLFYQRFRPNFTRAGFEVIDCPVLTAGQKNAADIRMVIDLVQLLNTTTRYDEFIIASADADFTPLLQLLRAQDRRTTVISAGPTAPAYHSIADVYLDAENLVDLLVEVFGLDDVTDAPKIADKPAPEQLATAQNVLREYIRKSDVPVRLSKIGSDVRNELGGDVIDQTGWFGHDSLSALLRSMEFPVEGEYVWDPRISHRPNQPSSAATEIDPDVGPQRLLELIDNVCRITDLPKLDRADWKPTFDTLARYARSHVFNLSECTRWTRDQLEATGHSVGRAAIGWVVKAVALGGARLDGVSAPQSEDIRDALIRTTIDRAQAATLELTEDDVADLREWLTGNGENR